MTILKSYHLNTRSLVLSVIPKQVSTKAQNYLQREACNAFKEGATSVWTIEFALELLEEIV